MCNPPGTRETDRTNAHKKRVVPVTLPTWNSSHTSGCRVSASCSLYSPIWLNQSASLRCGLDFWIVRADKAKSILNFEGLMVIVVCACMCILVCACWFVPLSMSVHECVFEWRYNWIYLWILCVCWLTIFHLKLTKFLGVNWIGV